MATNKKSFVLYTDIIESIRLLDDTKAGELFKHILSYVNDENPTTNDVIINLAFTPIKQSLKRDLIKYDTYINKQSENGKKGGRPKTQKTQPFISKPKKADSVSVSVSDSVSVNDNKIHIPTLQEFLNHGNTKLAYQNKDAQYYNHALTSKYNTWLDDDWKNAHGKKIKNWRNALNNTLPYLKPIYPDKKSIPFTTKKHIPKAPEPRKKVAVTIDDLTSGNLAEQKRAWEQKIKEANNNQSKRVSRAETLRQAHNS